MSTQVQDWTVLSMLEWATDYFEERNIPDPRLSIEWLLAEVLHINRLDLYLKFDRPLSEKELTVLRPLVKRRAHHEPLQYIIGHTDFMHAEISVTADVLIPRIETEQLVEIILDEHANDKALNVLDIGTGSGCIPIALKMERPAWNVAALDISEKALEVARKNAAQNNVEVNFEKNDINHPDHWAFSGPFDLIISNPPYVLPKEKKTLARQVKNYEPSLALFCDDLDKIYQNIISAADRLLTPTGTLYLEINERYDQQILSIFELDKWAPSLLRDYAKKNRFIAAPRHR